eukprot:13507034-Alexandrium_andersonii.AAC.1
MAAAHFAAETSALVYYIDPEGTEMKLAYPNTLFDRDISDGRAMMHSLLMLTNGVDQAMGDI